MDHPPFSFRTNARSLAEDLNSNAGIMRLEQQIAGRSDENDHNAQRDQGSQLQLYQLLQV
ncbi:hypothetical protein FY034_18970 (plasmid) [Trichlorobacter lovleyi]|uniref:hypothetical protein n=1 Tax=Trichlorobacter lovleyi TaxID=313985 RepID=UPI0022407F9C|nr:hypothetical protein [Trichlorobacter lovleyi]QOX81060.1 hypothetical protein FY034_18970 [Trichlorobacter lovleyi]